MLVCKSRIDPVGRSTYLVLLLCPNKRDIDDTEVQKTWPHLGSSIVDSWLGVRSVSNQINK